ncbi:MAG TPA: PaaI family thioesterase [Thermoplasmata archaeon]|nr:PaaI family thioesterase [Thermoplasmata archaeon]
MASARVRQEPKPVRPPPDWTKIHRHGGFHEEVGFSVVSKESHDGTCVISGRVEARHLNVNGVVHGGVYATILDTAMGGALLTLLHPDETTATTSLYVEFLRPAQQGAVLRAKGEVVRRGHHLAFVEGNLFDGEGTRLSQAHGTWYIWNWTDRGGIQPRPSGGRPPQPPRAKSRS